MARFRLMGVGRLALAVLLGSSMLLACGGGGGSDDETVAPTTPTPTNPTPTPILDSFGVDASSLFAGGGDGASAGGDGTAGDGAPIANGTVVYTDVAGKTATATTDAGGYYRVNITGFTPPFVVKVTRADGVVRHSLNVNPLKLRGFVTVNISGVTDKIASDVAVAGGRTGAAQLTPQILAANTGAVSTSITNLRTTLRAAITNAGLDPATYDPLTAPFKADHTGYDKVLDNTIITVLPNGQTQVAPSPAVIGGGVTSPGTTFLAGMWTFQNFYQNTALDTPSDPLQLTQEVNTEAFWRTTGLTTENTLVAFSGCGSCGVQSTIKITYYPNGFPNDVIQIVWTRVN